MLSEEELLRDTVNWLKERVVDVEAYIKTVRGKKAREELKRFARRMQAGDELWEYEWAAQVGPRDCYDVGWCIVREKQAVARWCAHSS